MSTVRMTCFESLPVSVFQKKNSYKILHKQQAKYITFNDATQDNITQQTNKE